MTSLRRKYNSLPADTKTSVRESIMKKCGFNKRSFYRKLDLPGSIKLPEKKIFMQLLGATAEELYPKRIKKQNIHQDDQN